MRAQSSRPQKPTHMPLSKEIYHTCNPAGATGGQRRVSGIKGVLLSSTSVLVQIVKFHKQKQWPGEGLAAPWRAGPSFAALTFSSILDWRGWGESLCSRILGWIPPVGLWLNQGWVLYNVPQKGPWWMRLHVTANRSSSSIKTVPSEGHRVPGHSPSGRNADLYSRGRDLHSSLRGHLLHTSPLSYNMEESQCLYTHHRSAHLLPESTMETIRPVRWRLSLLGDQLYHSSAQTQEILCLRITSSNLGIHQFTLI